ncbi:DMP19 family protein [Solirubrobacter taibaiensis]|nr:DMP19 family protein [Solirubrobacter taibaiensis]
MVGMDWSDEFATLQALHEQAFEYLVAGRLDELAPGLRALTVLFTIVGQVDNGGFRAWIDNSSDGWTEEAIAAARLVGADPHAAVFERFAAGPRDDATLDTLDEDFYALPSIDGSLTRYVAEHPRDFELR